MRVNDLEKNENFKLLVPGNHGEDQISKPFCCDLLSIAMNHCPAGGAWVTVMANVNTLAVASLTDAGCVILACGSSFDDATIEKAIAEGITVYTTDLESFEAAYEVYQNL